MTRFMIAFTCCAALAAGACKNKDKGGGSADNAGGADKTAEGAAKLPPLTAEPDPGTITAAEKPPFESVKLRMLDKRNAHGWPKYAAYNYGTKVVTALAIYGYAYDASGKQVGRTQTPMSWNGKLTAGGKSDWDVEIGLSGPDVPETAASYDVCFDSIKFDGDANWTEDSSRCPEQKPKAK